MSYTISLIGAPGSGKSTFAAKLYAELLENGINGTKLITEYAVDFLGAGGTITFENQKMITEKQRELEQNAIKSNFQYIICDSNLILGAIYAEYSNWHEEDEHILWDVGVYSQNLYNNTKYDMTIYIPLFDDLSKKNLFRLHNNDESVVIDDMIRQRLDNIEHVVAPVIFEDRDAFIHKIAQNLKYGK